MGGLVDLFKYQIPASSADNKPGGNLLSGLDRLTFVIATGIYSSSPPLFLAPRFWEPRDQPQPGFFLEARERTMGTRFELTLGSNVLFMTSTSFMCSTEKNVFFSQTTRKQQANRTKNPTISLCQPAFCKLTLNGIRSKDN